LAERRIGVTLLALPTRVAASTNPAAAAEMTPADVNCWINDLSQKPDARRKDAMAADVLPAH
jgi:hypothetical protein